MSIIWDPDQDQEEACMTGDFIRVVITQETAEYWPTAYTFSKDGNVTCWTIRPEVKPEKRKPFGDKVLSFEEWAAFVYMVKTAPDCGSSDIEEDFMEKVLNKSHNPADKGE